MSKGADEHGFQTTNNYHCLRGKNDRLSEIYKCFKKMCKRA